MMQKNSFFDHELRQLDRRAERMRNSVAPGAPAGSNRIYSGNMFVNPEARRNREADRSVVAQVRSRSAAGGSAPGTARSASCAAAAAASASGSERQAAPGTARGHRDPYFQQQQQARPLSARSASAGVRGGGGGLTRSVAAAPSSAAALLVQQQQQQQNQSPVQPEIHQLESRPIPGHQCEVNNKEGEKKKLKRKLKVPDVSAISRQQQQQGEEDDRQARVRAEEEEMERNNNLPVSARLSPASGIYSPKYQEEAMLSARGLHPRQYRQQHCSPASNNQQQHPPVQRATSSSYYTRRPTNYGVGAVGSAAKVPPPPLQGAVRRSASAGAARSPSTSSAAHAAAAAAAAGVLYDSTSRPQPSPTTAHRFTPREAMDAAFVRSDSNVAVAESGIPRRLAHMHNLREDTETRIARCIRSGLSLGEAPGADVAQELNASAVGAPQQQHHHLGEGDSSAAGAAAFVFENNSNNNKHDVPPSSSSYHRSASALTHASASSACSPRPTVAPPQGSALQCFLEDPPPCTYAVSAGRKVARSQLNFITSPADSTSAVAGSVSMAGGGGVSRAASADASTRRDLAIGVSPRPFVSPGISGYNSRSASAMAAGSMTAAAQQQQPSTAHSFISSPSSHANSRSASAARGASTAAEEESDPQQQQQQHLQNHHHHQQEVVRSNSAISNAAQTQVSVAATTAATSSSFSPPNVITSPRYDRYDLFPAGGTLFKKHRPLVEAAEAVTRLTPEDFVDLYRHIFAAEDTERFRVPPLVSSGFAALAAAALRHREGDELEQETAAASGASAASGGGTTNTKLPSPIDATDCLSPLGETDAASLSENQSQTRKHQLPESSAQQQQQQQKQTSSSDDDDEIFIPDDLSPEQQAQRYAAQLAARQLKQQQQRKQDESAARQLNLSEAGMSPENIKHLQHLQQQQQQQDPPSDFADSSNPAAMMMLTSSPRLRRIIDLNDMSPERYCLFTAAWSSLWCLAVALDLPCISAHRRYDKDLVLPRRPSLHELQSEFFGGTQISVVGAEQERDPTFEPKVCTVATKVVATTVEFDKGLTRAHAVRLDTALRHATRWIAEAVKVRDDIAAAYRSMQKRSKSQEEHPLQEGEGRILSSLSPVSDASNTNTNSRSVSPRSPDNLPEPQAHPLGHADVGDAPSAPAAAVQRSNTARTNDTAVTAATTMNARRENSLEAALERVRPFDGHPAVLTAEGEEQTLQVAKTVLRWAAELRDASVKMLA